MEKTLFLDTSRDLFISWLEDYDQPLNLQRVRKSLEKNVWQMEYINLTSTEDGRTVAQPIPNAIWFKIISLASDRIECTIKCPHPRFQDYCSQLLSDINERWPQNQQEIMSRLTHLVELNQAIFHEINDSQKKQLEKISEMVQHDRLEQGEMGRTIDAIRRVLRNVLANNSEIGPDIFAILKEQESAIENASDLRHKFELSIPLLPFLSYKIEWSSDMRQDFDQLNQIWQQLKNKINQ